jgi:hypothetical protein
MPRKSPFARFVGCIAKGCLGCLAFGIGMLVVALLLLPHTLGRFVVDEVVDHMNSKIAGSIDVGESWVPMLYGTQEIERIELRDPDKRRVAVGTLRLPSAWNVGKEPAHLSVERLDLEVAEDGSLNLFRALAPPPANAPATGVETDVQGGVSYSLEQGGHAVLEIRSLRWSTPELRASGATFELVDLRGEATLGEVRHASDTDPGGTLDITLAGRLHGQPDTIVEIEVHLADILRVGEPGSGSVRLATVGLDEHARELLAGPAGLLPTLFRGLEIVLEEAR